MLDINDLKIGTIIEYKGEPYTVISSRHTKLGRGGAVQQTKLKNLISGNVISKNFKGGDRLAEPEITKAKVQFLYQEDGKFYFMDEKTYEQFGLDEKRLGKKIDFLKEGASAEVLYFNGKPINVAIPLKIVLEVIEAPPGVRGDTAQGGSKQVTLETEAKINAPLFIKKGDRVRVNTETGEYVERA